VSRDLLLLVFFHESISPQVQSIPIGRFQIFSKIRGDIRKSRCTTGVNDTGGKFANGVVDNGCNLPPVSLTQLANLPPVSTTPAANFATSFISVADTGGKLPPVSTTPVANWNNENNIRLQIP
jgi:hypothetical protein